MTTALNDDAPIIPSPLYRLDSHIFETDVKVHHQRVPGRGPLAYTVVSHVLICVSETSYHEVAVWDDRSLDVRGHRWKVIESNLDLVHARMVYRAVWEATEVGHRVYGVRWVDGRPEAVITRDCALSLGLVESR